MGNAEVKLLLFSDSAIAEEATQTSYRLELLSRFSKVAGYKVLIQKPISFLQASAKQKTFLQRYNLQ